MKVRVGFVSNSSSASFVMVGVDIDALGINRDELAKALADAYLDEDTKWEDLYDVCYEIGKVADAPRFNRACEGRYFGITIARWTNEESAPDYELTVQDIEDYAWTVEDMLAGVGYKTARATLIGGEEVC